MSPLIEQEQNIDKGMGFYIRLDDETEFDPAKFDEMVRRVYPTDLFLRKFRYVVRGDTMLVVTENIDHARAQYILDCRGAGDLKSAGFVEVMLSPDEVVRDINGFSQTLHIHRLLSKGSSDEYKNTVLAEKLGKYFKISE